MVTFQFEVIAVRHEAGDHSKIILYKVKDLLNWLAKEDAEMDRMNMIMRLGANMRFGVRENPSDETLVPIITENINGHIFIKTIANGIPEDNLGSLPEF